MPGFNGLGPINNGTMTGKGRGYCIKELQPGENPNFLGGFGGRRGMARGGMTGGGRGRGRGNVVPRGRGLYCGESPVQREPLIDKAQLEERKAMLKEELEMIDKQLLEEEQIQED